MGWSLWFAIKSNCLGFHVWIRIETHFPLECPIIKCMPTHYYILIIKCRYIPVHGPWITFHHYYYLESYTVTEMTTEINKKYTTKVRKPAWNIFLQTIETMTKTRENDHIKPQNENNWQKGEKNENYIYITKKIT